MNPRASLPPSAVTRDPFWYDLGDLDGLRPYRASSYLPPSLRDSYLSPVKRRYLWTKHPIRPFGKYFHSIQMEANLFMCLCVNTMY